MRRGQAEMVEWLTRLVMLAVVVVLITLLVRVYTERDIESSQLQRGAYLYRIYYSDIIMYRDAATTRVYPGIVDLSKFTDQRLNDVFVEREPADAIAKIASSLTVTPSQACSLPQQTIYNNKNTYDLYAANAMQGIGGATAEIDTFPVTLKSGGTECAGVLNITVVRPNS
jgi:hypothetical protein